MKKSDSLLEERACPRCGQSSIERAVFIVEPTLCPECRFRESLRRTMETQLTGSWYCPVCRVEVSRPWKAKHEGSKNHKLMLRITFPAPAVEPAAVLALEERRRA